MKFIVNRYKMLKDYDIIEMNTYYRCLDVYENKEVLVKLMEHSDYMFEDFLMNLRDESTTISEIDCPQIMKMLDVGIHYTEDNLFYYIVTDDFDGIGLDELIKGNYIHLEGAINICNQIVKALEVAQSHKMYHGDLKPSAILVDKDYNIRISDFGLTKANHGINVRNCSEIRYLSPHQICINYTDSESDYYSLGLILFECIFKKSPFNESYDERELLKEIDKGINWVEIRAINGNEALLKVIKKLLSRKDKYRNTQEIIIDLSDIMYDKANILVEENNEEDDLEKEEIKNKKSSKDKIKVFIASIAFIAILVTSLM